MTFIRGKVLPALFLLLIGSYDLKAQDEDVSQYFDDGGISNARAALQLNLLSLAAGDFSLSLEYAVTKHIGIDVCGGLLLPYPSLSAYYPDFYPDSGYARVGLSYAIQPKIYFDGRAPEGMYYSLLYRVRMHPGATTFDLIPSQGFKVQTNSRWVWEFYYGVGVRLINNQMDQILDASYAFAVGAKFGIVF